MTKFASRAFKERLRKTIQRATEQGVSEDKLRELNDYLEELEAKSFQRRVPARSQFEEFETEQGRVVIVSTVPGIDRDEFEGLSIRDVNLK
jgi:hypothetical protein